MNKNTERTRRKQGRFNQDRRLYRKGPEPSVDQLPGRRQDSFRVSQTPFRSPVKGHAALLDEAKSNYQRANMVLRLQRTHGNAYVQRLLKSRDVQAKLTVSPPNDIHEQEADSVADKVVMAMNAQAPRQEEPEEEMAMTKSMAGIQRQEEPEEELAMTRSRSERQSKEDTEEEISATIPMSGIPRQEEPEEELAMTNSMPEIQRQEEPEEEMAMTGSVSDQLEASINAASGKGQSLSANIRKPMERIIGADFSSVHVHKDSEADMLSKQLNAKAFTSGKDIFFREGEYNSESNSGRKLIAHELTHVVQQGGASVLRKPVMVEEAEGKEEKTTLENNADLQGDSLDRIQRRKTSKRVRDQIEWGRSKAHSDAGSIESRWSAAAKPGTEISWAASADALAINQPQQVSWGITEQSSDAGDGIPKAISTPTTTTLTNLENTYGVGVRGIAPWPTNAKAPNFDFNTTQQKGPKGTTQWVCNPTLTQNSSEGDSQPLYLGKGDHKTTQKDAATNTWEWRHLTAAISKADYNAENDHGKDYKKAAKISVQEAEDVLQNHIVGKSFGPKPTSVQAEQMVLDAITANLTHAQLGNDKTKWLGKYSALQKKTLDRDTKGWHTFSSTNRREIKNAKGKVIKVIYDLVKGPNFKVNVNNPSIKY